MSPVTIRVLSLIEARTRQWLTTNAFVGNSLAALPGLVESKSFWWCGRLWFAFFNVLDDTSTRESSIHISPMLANTPPRLSKCLSVIWWHTLFAMLQKMTRRIRRGLWSCSLLMRSRRYTLLFGISRWIGDFWIRATILPVLADYSGTWWISK